MKPYSIGLYKFSRFNLARWLKDRHFKKPYEKPYCIIGTSNELFFPSDAFLRFLSMYFDEFSGRLFATCPVEDQENKDALWSYFYCGTNDYIWKPPLNKKFIGITTDSMSFQNIDTSKEIEIPVGQHVGAFGYKRRFDVHKGIDLYASDGEDVFAVEDGIVTNIRPFTGEKCESPWWNDTEALSISGWSGNVVYGEIEIDKSMIIGKEVRAGEKVGVVRTVLKKDKGRPRSMLHLAVHRHGIQTNGVWEIGSPQPIGLVDPAVFLSPLFLK